MPRAARIDVGEHVYHVLNRANGRRTIFETDADYSDFEYLLREMKEVCDIRVLAYVVMPNHWHMLLYPRHDGDLGRSLRWLSTSHVRRHHERKGTVGEGHLYQGRYKSFLVKDDNHLLTVLKYIERNPVRARLCEFPEQWRWGSGYVRSGTTAQRALLSDSPVPLPHDYAQWIRELEPSEILTKLRQSVNKNIPYGEIILNNITPQK
jgi:putative transposase